MVLWSELAWTQALPSRAGPLPSTGRIAKTLHLLSYVDADETPTVARRAAS